MLGAAAALLGLYTDRDKAQRRVKLVGTIGLTAGMAERILPGTVYWRPNAPAAAPRPYR